MALRDFHKITEQSSINKIEIGEINNKISIPDNSIEIEVNSNVINSNLDDF